MIIGALEAGGTKMVCAVGDETGKIYKRISIPTKDPDTTLREILIFFKSEKIECLGIGCFGPICLDRDSKKYGYITSTPKEEWRDVDIYGSLKNALNVPVGFDTDVNASVLGEVKYGAGKGLKNVCYLTVGTGIGMGIWSEGKLLHGNLHPEAGHIKIRKRADDTYAGKCPYHKDCFEGLAAGPAIEERFGIKASELSDRDDVWNLIGFYIAQALCSYILILAPQKIILGGGVMHQEKLLPYIRKYVREELAGYINTEEMNNLDDYIVPFSLNDNQGILGCFELAKIAYEE